MGDFERDSIDAMSFEDHFSGHADAYARHRPRYPDALFAWIDSVVRDRELAWDVGTGSGQVAVALAERMKRVFSTDASAGQLSHALTHERVEYRCEPADRSSLPADSVDLITAGAAAHWFALDGFYDEVRRVAKRGAVIALWSYGPRDIASAIDPIVHRFQEEVLEGLWPQRIQYVHEQYRTLPFPFEELQAPSFTMVVEWTSGDLLAFLETWSASQKYRALHGRASTGAIADELEAAWGDEVRRRFEWPLFLRAGRV